MAAGRAQVLDYKLDACYFDGNQKRVLSISATPVSGDPVNTVFIEFLDATPPNNGIYVSSLEGQAKLRSGSRS